MRAYILIPYSGFTTLFALVLPRYEPSLILVREPLLWFAAFLLCVGLRLKYEGYE